MEAVGHIQSLCPNICLAGGSFFESSHGLGVSYNDVTCWVVEAGDLSFVLGVIRVLSIKETADSGKPLPNRCR